MPVLLLSLHTPEPASPAPFHHPTLPSAGTEGNQQRGKWVSHIAVWEKWERGRRVDTAHMGESVCLLSKSNLLFSR